jgi:hypothetical protein
MTDKIVDWVEERSSRRGFLGKTGKLVAGVGLGLLAGGVGASTAGAVPFCCTGTQCFSCPATIGQCPTGYSYTGYTWICCYDNRAAYCWDCTKNGSTCYCNRLSGQVCN